MERRLPWQDLRLPRPAMLIMRRLLAPLGVLIAAGIALLFLGLTVLPLTGFYATYTVLSDSMEPTISKGSVVLVLPTDPSHLQVGDIISYTSRIPPYPTLTHRVTNVYQDANGLLTLKTKGDANLVEDPWELHYANKAGIVVGWIPLVGYAIVAATTAAARVLLGLLLAGVLALVWFTAVWARPKIAAAAASLVRTPSPGDSRTAGVRGLSLVRLAILSWLTLTLLTTVRKRLQG